MISLDGAFLEGGGQIIRTALGLSALTGRPFEVKDIRKGRREPGLKNQHLFGIKAFEELCGAKAEGAALGSTAITFAPGKIKPQTLSIDIGTAGSISLLLQSLLIASTFSKGKIRLKLTGGTDVIWSPQFDYLNNVILPQLRRYAEIETSLQKRGYYPKGAGKVEIKIKSEYGMENISEAPKINLDQQYNLIQIKGISHASLDLQKAEVAERHARQAKLLLTKLNCPIQIRTEYSDTLSTGSGITLWSVFSKDPGDIDIKNPIILGADSLGERGKRAEEVGKIAAEKLIKGIESKAPVDSHLADNLIPYIALAKGKIKVSEISNHTLTNIYTCEQFLGKVFTVDSENRIIEAK